MGAALALCVVLVASGPSGAQQPDIEEGWEDFKRSLLRSGSSVDGPPLTSSLTPEEKRLRQRRHEYIDNLVLRASIEKAAVVGGIALAGCLLLSEKKRKRCIAVALGVGAGTFLYSRYVDSRRVKGKEDQVLDAEAMAADLEQEVVALRQLNEDARKVAVQNNQRIVALRARVHSNRISMSDAQREQARIESNVNAVTDALEAGKKELAGWEDVLDETREKGGSVYILGQKIEQKRMAIAELEAIEDSMLEQLQSVPTLEPATPAFDYSQDSDSGGGDP
ncbi:MAG: hypothetical protein GKR94_21415 [Gammaproteobacteria bacterium]|nr:hypothetical protein [Gammaproteobacteria bacterium]